MTKKKSTAAKADAKALPVAAPPPSAFAGTQLSLFQAFLCNTEEERDQLSNTIELWDSIPKYAISQQVMNQTRTKEGLLPRLGRPSSTAGTNTACASPRRSSMRRRAGATEPITRAPARSWWKMPCARSPPSSTRASSTNRSSREGPDSRWVAHFHPLVTQSIDTLSYRQYNYHLMMSHSTQLARWLHKILSHSYVNASYTVPYRMSLSSIRRDSGLLECRRINDDVRKLGSALRELVDHKVLLGFTREDQRGPRNKILDIDYALTPHMQFVGDVKAANKRQQPPGLAPRPIPGAPAPREPPRRFGRREEGWVVGLPRNWRLEMVGLRRRSR